MPLPAWEQIIDEFCLKATGDGVGTGDKMPALNGEGKRWLLMELGMFAFNRASTCGGGIQSHPSPLPNKHLLRRDKETILLVQAKPACFPDASINR